MEIDKADAEILGLEPLLRYFSNPKEYIRKNCGCDPCLGECEEDWEEWAKSRAKDIHRKLFLKTTK